MLVSKMDPVFVSTGFRNWKKAVEKFTAHAKSQSHCHATTVYAQETAIPCVQSVLKDKRDEDAFQGFLSKQM